MGLYDNVLAEERDRVGLQAANMTAGRGGVFLAAKGAERMNQGARQMFGIEEPVVIAAKAEEAKQTKLNNILSKFTSMKTRADYQKAANELYANNYTDHAAKVIAMMKDLPNPNSKPETYKSNSGTRYLTDGINYKAGDLVPGETAVTETKTFVQNGVVYDRTTLQPLIKDSKPNVDTFMQGGVVYNALTLNPMLKGSEQDRETFMQDGITYYKDTKLPVILGSEPERDSKLVNGTWRYVDNQKKVFTSINAPEDAEDQAAEIYANVLQFNPVNENEIAPVLTNEKKVALARELIQAKLADTKIFSDLMASIDKDSVNSIQQENLLVKAVERLSVNYNDAGIGEMDNILTPIESLLNEYVPHLRQNGEFVYDRAGNAMRDYSEGIPGWSFINRYERYVGNDATTSAAKDFSEKAQRLINTIIKERSGSAVSIQEAERLTAEYETGFRTSESFANWVGQVRSLVEQNRMEVVSGYAPEVQYRYFSQMGIFPTLTDPDVQLKALPIGAKWKDESGQVYIKNKNDD